MNTDSLLPSARRLSLGSLSQGVLRHVLSFLPPARVSCPSQVDSLFQLRFLLPVRTNVLDVDFYRCDTIVNAEVFTRLCDWIKLDSFLDTCRLRVEDSISIGELECFLRGLSQKGRLQISVVVVYEEVERIYEFSSIVSNCPTASMKFEHRHLARSCHDFIRPTAGVDGHRLCFTNSFTQDHIRRLSTLSGYIQELVLVKPPGVGVAALEALLTRECARRSLNELVVCKPRPGSYYIMFVFCQHVTTCEQFQCLGQLTIGPNGLYSLYHHIAQGITNGMITYLDVGECALDQLLEISKVIGASRTLQHVAFSANETSLEEVFASLDMCTSLSSICMRGYQPNHESRGVLKGLCKRLCSLSLENKDPVWKDELASSLDFKQLSTLRLAGFLALNDSSMFQVAEATALVKLDLSTSIVLPRALDVLSSARFPQLKALHLDFRHGKPYHLENLLCKKEIKVLCLSNVCYEGGMSCSLKVGLRRNRTISVLSLHFGSLSLLPKFECISTALKEGVQGSALTEIYLGPFRDRADPNLFSESSLEIIRFHSTNTQKGPLHPTVRREATFACVDRIGRD